MKKYFSAFLAFIIICVNISFVSAEENNLKVKDVVNQLLADAHSYNPSVSSESLLNGSSFVMEDYVTKAQCYYMVSKAFSNLPQLQGDCLANAPEKPSFYDMPLWASNEVGKLIACGLVDGEDSQAFRPLDYVTQNDFDTLLRRVYRLYGTDKQDDFYSTVNHLALQDDNSAILSENGNINTIDEAQKANANRFDDILNQCIDGEWTKGTKQDAIKNLYLTIQDTKSRNEQGAYPINNFISQLSKVKNDSELNDFVMKYTKETNMAAFVNFSLAPSPSDNSNYSIYFDCYVPLMYISVSQNEEELESYKNYIRDMLVLAGEDKKTATRDAENVLSVEKLLSENITAENDSEFMETTEDDASVGQTDIMEKMYKSYDLETIDSKFKTLDLKGMLEAFGYDTNLPLVIWDMNRVDRLSALFDGKHTEQLASLQKAYMVSIAGMYLSQDFYDLYDNFLMKIYGTNESILDTNMSPRTFVSNQMNTYISQIFCEKYFPEDKKKEMELMVENIRSVFRERLSKLTWMSEATKKKALEKLNAMEIQVGYPDRWQCYLDYAEIKSPSDGGTYYSNMIRINKAIVEGSIDFYKNHNVEDMWEVQPYDVNAYYIAEKNKMIVPAGICEALNATNSKEGIYGSIGVVIAHEMTHAFDLQGAMYDKNGKMNNWWTDADYANFHQLCKKVENFYNGYEAATGIKTDGEKTLNENIADLGGMACALDAVAKLGNPNYDRFFSAYAKTFFSSSTREYLTLLSVLDQHSYGSVRVKRTLSNFQKFYDIYNVKENDGMYVKPEDRVAIW